MTFDVPAIRRSLLVLAVGVAALVAAGCGDGGSGPSGGAEVEGTISRETFISVYVDLRLEALQRDRETVTEAERDDVLRRHDVEEEDLLRFVEVHGDRVDYMRALWNEVDERIRRRSDGTDTTETGGEPGASTRHRTPGSTTPMLRAS